MNRRDFSKHMVMLGAGVHAGNAMGVSAAMSQSRAYYEEPMKKLPVRKFDVVVAGGGTAGAVAPAASSTLVNVSLQGDNFSQAGIRGLLENINDVIEDGGRRRLV